MDNRDYSAPTQPSPPPSEEGPLRTVGRATIQLALVGIGSAGLLFAGMFVVGLLLGAWEASTGRAWGRSFILMIPAALVLLLSWQLVRRSGQIRDWILPSRH